MKLFSKFDIQWGYNNIWICDKDWWKTAFKTRSLWLSGWLILT
jgi:hypothetical protein